MLKTIKNEVTQSAKVLAFKRKYSVDQGDGAHEIIPRDFMEMMEVPFLALSMRRTKPINYENPKKGVKVRVTRHTEHFLASIYDWDIIFVASKMQEILNNGTDIPPRTMVFPRHEILKALHKFDERKQQKDLEKSLLRLKTTLIETTIRNKDYKYEAFGFLDSWGYTERRDIKEIRITLSQWLYDGICAKSSLLKVSKDYFDITSGLKRFLYRTARKHVGNNSKAWEFSLEKLYEKSGSEQDIYSFKKNLKAAVQANDLPDYNMLWIERNKKYFVSFMKKNGKLIIDDEMLTYESS
jgi:plasmid replication initiation protein